MKRQIMFSYVFIFLFIFSSCSIVSHMDEITTIQNYSHEKDAQHKLVKSINARYDTLTKAIDEGHIKEYKDQASFEKSFGDPILKKDMPDGTERWLYRYAVYRFAKDEVDVYFDHNGQMIKWERIPCSKLY